jgi:CRISPR-associated endonuclease Csn1
MARTLGLDIGTNSIGWCIVEDGKDIIAMGSRIFPVGVKEDTYAKSGTEESRNAARRTARGIRRGYARYKLRRAELERILTEHGMMFDKAKSLPTKELYGLRRDALDRRLGLDEIGRIFFLMNQRRGFKSNRKEQAKGDEAKKLSSTKQAMREFEDKMHAAGCRTAGEYVASLFDNQPENWHNENEPRERIREKQRIRRELYQQEFDLIWAKQREYHPAILTEELKRQLRDRVIFFQRKLKSAKHLVSRCRFEPNKHVMPKSHPLFQEFRLLQKLADVRVTYQARVNEPLTLPERRSLALELSKAEKVNVTLIKEWLDYPRSARINDLGDDLKGNTTWSRIRKAVGDDWFERQTEEAKLKLWHTLYFAADEGWIEEYAQRALGMNDEQAKLFAAVNLELDYGSISHKAASRIVPLMRDGHDFATACAEAGYHHSQNELDDPDRPLKDKLTGADIDALRNPLVQMTVNETARLVSAIIKQHGKPDQVRVELLRELKKPKAVREKMRNSMRDKERLRDEYRAFLKAKGVMANPYPSDIKKFELWLELEYSEADVSRLAPDMDLKAFKKFAEAVSPKDREKFQLWLECDRISPYTGKAIPLAKLFTEAYHVEHILPYSRSLDDSFVNKTLCEDAVNDEKGNLTPLEYFEQKRSPEELKAFKQRVKDFSEAKLAKFLATEVKDDFLNSQYTNSAYIGTEVRKLLRKAFKDVRVTNGQLTGLLRNKVWRLNDLLNTAPDQKDRDDHRHHALDALVIACTSQSLVNRISRESQFDYRGVQRAPDIGLPWPNFRLDAARHLNGLLVSYRNGKRLLSAKKNKYTHSKAHDGKPEKVQRTLAVRGPLHEETLYGRITIQNKGSKEETYVVRKALTSLTKVEQLENIVDPVVRKTIQDHVAAHGSLREALKVPVHMPVKQANAGKLIPIKSVRMRVGTEEMIELRPKTYVEPGNNFCIAIYEDAKGKRTFRTVSFFEAAQRARRKEPLYPAEMEGKKLLMALQQRDLVVLYDKHPEEIQWNDAGWMANHLYLVRKFDRNGIIGMVLHKAAKANPERPRETPEGYVAKRTPNTLRGVKVMIDRLGVATPTQ